MKTWSFFSNPAFGFQGFNCTIEANYGETAELLAIRLIGRRTAF